MVLQHQYQVQRNVLIFVNSEVMPGSVSIPQVYKEERDTIRLRDKTILAVAMAVFGLSLRSIAPVPASGSPVAEIEEAA
jgi:hypothetical protein